MFSFIASTTSNPPLPAPLVRLILLGLGGEREPTTCYSAPFLSRPSSSLPCNASATPRCYGSLSGLRLSGLRLSGLRLSEHPPCLYSPVGGRNERHD